MSEILRRFEADSGNYPYIDTKFDIVSNRDFGENDEPFRRKECIYSWIQGRGIESIAGHIVYFRKNDNSDLAARLTKMLSTVTMQMEKLRRQNGGRLPFAMTPDGRSFFKQSGSHAGYSDLFYSKGLFAASQVLGDPKLEHEAEELFSFVLEKIEDGSFRTDQQCFDPKNNVSYIPGKFPQGPKMIALGGLAEWMSAKPEETRWADTAERFIRFIFEHHINRGQYANCQLWDFIESVDSEKKPWYDGFQLFCDPGHALEFTGLAGKCLRALRQQGRKSDLIEESGTILPQVFIHTFDCGFNHSAGGICKGFDLASGTILNSDMPWWSLPETVRAGMEISKLYPDNHQQEILIRTGQAFQAFVQGFLQPNGFGCQTRDNNGCIVNVIPAVPDADPGYHTNLSLLDVLKLM